MEREQEERLKNVAKAAIGVAALYGATRVVQYYKRNGEQGQVYITPYDNFFVEKLDKAGNVFLRLSGKIINFNRDDGTFDDLEHSEDTSELPEDEIRGFERLYVEPPVGGENTLQTG